MFFPTAIDRARLSRELRETRALAVPLMLGQVATMGMPLVDTLLAGHLGALTLAAVGIGSTLWTLANLFLIGVLLALPPTVAQLDGAGRHDDIGPVFRQALWLALFIGGALSCLIYQCEPLLRVAKVDPAVIPPAMAFLRAIAWGAPALALYFTLRGLSEGLSLPRPSIYFSLVGLAVLLPVGYVLMYGRLGFPALGARGSGVATALALWVQAGAFLAYVARRRHYRAFALFARFDWPEWPRLMELLRVGVPMGVSIFMEGGLFIATALLIGSLGATAVASHQIALNVASLVFMMPLGLAFAITVRVGNAVGRQDATGVRYAGFVGIGLALATQCLSASLLMLAPHRIATLYTADPAVIALAAQLLLLAGVFQFSDGLQVVSNGALRGLKDTRVPMLLTLLAYWGVGMPLGYVLGFTYGMGARGLWVGLIAGLSMAAVLLFLRFCRIARGPLAVAAAPAAYID